MKKLHLFLPCVILILVACSQIYLTHSSALLTPAKGGGFGMFATVDKLTNRILVLHQHVDGQRLKLDVNQDSEIFKKHVSSKWEAAAAFPTQSRLDQLANTISFYLFPEINHFTIEVSKCSFEQISLGVSPVSLVVFTYIK